MGEASRKRCFFDISINNIDSGKIIFELFNDITPKTCENFRKLCTGEHEHGVGEVHGKQLYYKVSEIFRKIIDFNFFFLLGYNFPSSH
jgi:cyclophilin family peptidyl-prolyl cis-trans isomerase